MLYCFYYEKGSLWREYFSNISRHEISSILMFQSVIALTFAEFFIVKLVFLIKIRLMCQTVV